MDTYSLREYTDLEIQATFILLFSLVGKLKYCPSHYRLYSSTVRLVFCSMLYV